jgi:4'-phosphopantetheinyl transferase
MERLAVLLSPDEHRRAARFRFDRDHRRFVVARGHLRLLLGRYLACEPSEIVFRYGAHGKPELPGLQFNLSHAGEVALYAFAQTRTVGIDVEVVRALDDADRLVDRFFSAHEVSAYRALSAETRRRAFTACWTRKEAFIKALGEGLTHPLDAFDVTVHPDEPPTLLDVRGGDPARWDMRALPVGDEYAATLVADTPPWTVRCLDASALPSSCFATL